MDGTNPGLQVNMRYPSSSIRGGIVTIIVEYANSGNIDIESPVLEMKSLSMSPISFTVDGLNNNTALHLPCIEQNGPGNILRPGARGSIVVYAKEMGGLGFTILLPDFKNK